MSYITLTSSDPNWPPYLTRRLGQATPAALHGIGPIILLAHHKTALFCSAHTPGDAILRAHDTARRLRDEGRTVISGFHSPIEKDCLQILLRGHQPIIICPARTIETLRIPAAYRSAFDAGRLLFLSPFSQQPKRITRESALYRNEIVAALADAAYIAHITSGGNTAQIMSRLSEWGVPIL
jgi:predicted Rossmann fold nucleotide-binding protein DprA/Smf involved in DNA uptake